MKSKKKFFSLTAAIILVCLLAACAPMEETGSQTEPGKVAESQNDGLLRVVGADTAHPSQQADGVTYTVTDVTIRPNASPQSAEAEGAAPYILGITMGFSGIDPNRLGEKNDDVLVSFNSDLSDPLELKDLSRAGDDPLYVEFVCDELPETIYFQPPAYSFFRDDQVVVTDVDTLEADVQYLEEDGMTRLELRYEAGDLPYIPRGATILAAKETPGETSEDALDYSSVSCSNYYDDNGDLISGGFVFLIPGQFQPATYYDILIDGYVEDLEQAEIIEIPVEE